MGWCGLGRQGGLVVLFFGLGGTPINSQHVGFRRPILHGYGLMFSKGEMIGILNGSPKESDLGETSKGLYISLGACLVHKFSLS